MVLTHCHTITIYCKKITYVNLEYTHLYLDIYSNVNYQEPCTGATLQSVSQVLDSVPSVALISAQKQISG